MPISGMSDFFRNESLINIGHVRHWMLRCFVTLRHWKQNESSMEWL